MSFATCLNCIDGRVQLPVITWITQNYNVQYVDMITKPGMDGFLASEESDISNIVENIQISVDAHFSKNIFIVGHYDCAGNPVDEIIHKNQIKKAANRIKSIFKDLNVAGLWVLENFSVQLIIEK